MLDRLITLIEVEYEGCSKPLNQVPSNCCSVIEMLVIDFDLVKDEFCKRNKIEPVLKSVDAIAARENCLFLIEMKSFPRTGKTAWKDFMEEHFYSTLEDEEGRVVMRSEGDCVGKIVDSLIILLAISGQAKMDEKFYAHILNAKKTTIKPLILTNISDEEYLTYSIAYLSIALSSRVENQIHFINCSMLDYRLST